MFVRWSRLSEQADSGRRLPGYRDAAVVRHFDAPEALDMRFYEVRARSLLNRVPAASRMPFRWTVNPYRGCGHACVYCFARPTHSYLGFDAGRDFEREIVVKVNAPETLRAELASPSWRGEHVALGTNTDPYQWVEGRYRLMVGIWLRAQRPDLVDRYEQLYRAGAYAPRPERKRLSGLVRGRGSWRRSPSTAPAPGEANERAQDAVRAQQRLF